MAVAVSRPKKSNRKCVAGKNARKGKANLAFFRMFLYSPEKWEGGGGGGKKWQGKKIAELFRAPARGQKEKPSAERAKKNEFQKSWGVCFATGIKFFRRAWWTGAGKIHVYLGLKINYSFITDFWWVSCSFLSPSSPCALSLSFSLSICPSLRFESDRVKQLTRF